MGINLHAGFRHKIMHTCMWLVAHFFSNVGTSNPYYRVFLKRPFYLPVTAEAEQTFLILVSTSCTPSLIRHIISGSHHVTEKQTDKQINLFLSCSYNSVYIELWGLQHVIKFTPNNEKRWWQLLLVPLSMFSGLGTNTIPATQ